MDSYIQSNSLSIPLRDNSIDLVVADPPFGINFTGKASNYNRDAKLVSEYKEITLNYPDFAFESLSEIHRVLKPTGTAWIIMGYTNLRFWESYGNYLFNDQIGHVIWKYQFGVYAKKRPVVSHYHLLIFTKGKKWTWNQQGYDEDVWYIKRPYRKGVAKYPNRLPEELVEQIILRSSNVGDKVFDPFVGSGTTAKVAQKLGRLGFGADISNNSSFWALTD
jgi:site-specific DNA-methyltransferase (adenine-specific)